MALLRKGSRGDEVRSLQERLNQLGWKLDADGIFGGMTYDAVIELQKAFGYTVDGLVGDGTQKLIDAQIGYGWNKNNEGAGDAAKASQEKK